MNIGMEVNYQMSFYKLICQEATFKPMDRASIRIAQLTIWRGVDSVDDDC